MSHRSFVCRCEDVTTHEIEDAIDRGLTRIEEIKRYTGLGTGPCQGTECVCALAKILIDRGLTDPSTVQPFTSRPPAEAITFGALAAIEDVPSESEEGAS